MGDSRFLLRLLLNIRAFPSTVYENNSDVTQSAEKKAAFLLLLLLLPPIFIPIYTNNFLQSSPLKRMEKEKKGRNNQCNPF